MGRNCEIPGTSGQVPDLAAARAGSGELDDISLSVVVGLIVSARLIFTTKKLAIEIAGAWFAEGGSGTESRGGSVAVPGPNPAKQAENRLAATPNNTARSADMIAPRSLSG